MKTAELSDRELLELAAKAAGRNIGGETDCDPIDRKFSDALGLWCAGPWAGWFNPLNDDGDALRLAVKLCIFPQIYDELVNAIGLQKPARQQVLIDGDPYAATRRAIVRAAAEIGKREQAA